MKIAEKSVEEDPANEMILGIMGETIIIPNEDMEAQARKDCCWCLYLQEPGI